MCLGGWALNPEQVNGNIGARWERKRREPESQPGLRGGKLVWNFDLRLRGKRKESESRDNNRDNSNSDYRTGKDTNNAKQALPSRPIVVRMNH